MTSPLRSQLGNETQRSHRSQAHGGRSTGPRTKQERRRLQEAMKERWLKKRGEQPIDVAGHMSECSGVQDTG